MQCCESETTQSGIGKENRVVNERFHFYSAEIGAKHSRNLTTSAGGGKLRGAARPSSTKICFYPNDGNTEAGSFATHDCELCGQRVPHTEN